jgi:hypothetical protein
MRTTITVAKGNPSRIDLTSPGALRPGFHFWTYPFISGRTIAKEKLRNLMGLRSF